MNRQPALWRDRREVNMTDSLDRLNQMTPEERARDALELFERIQRRLADAGIAIDHVAAPEEEEGK